VSLVAALLASATCLATPVHGDAVRAGPFTGYVVPQYDVVNGRFRLHVGAYRNRAAGLSQKIPWFVPRSVPVKGSLVVVGRRLGSVKRSFKDVLQQTSSSNNPHQWGFPVELQPSARRLLAAHIHERSRQRRANGHGAELTVVRLPRHHKSTHQSD
jgi:hypothetical protein